MNTPIKQAIQDDYADDFSWCYGCGRLNEAGHQLRTGWEGDKTMTLYTPDSDHTAIPGFVYGGLIASEIDCHGTGSASLTLHRKNGYESGSVVEHARFVTSSLHVGYEKPTADGKTIKA